MRLAIVLFVFFAFCASNCRGEELEPLTAPQLTNNPTLDVIATNRRPLLSFFNSSGGNGKRNYTIQSLKSNKKRLYGEQFHAEVKVPYNQGTPYLVNFLKMAIEKRHSKR